jgi:predicted dienelactone hydrolase
MGCTTESTPTPAPGHCDVSATADVDLGVSGPYRAGHRLIEVTYTPPGVGASRTIPVHIWYPTTATEGDEVRYLEQFDDPKSLGNAALAPPLSGCGYPVVAYSHGHQGFAGTGAQLMRHFASHGWVAIAPDHIQNTLFDNVDPRPTWMYYVRSTDMTQALDAVAKLPSGDPLSNKLATDRVLLTGHSYGTHTVWASAGATFDVPQIRQNCAPGACTEDEFAAFTTGVGDPRFVAGIPLAGAYRPEWFGNTGYQSVKIPLLQMTGTADKVDAAEVWDLTASVQLSWIELEGACHESFALGTACATLPTDEGYGIVDTYAMAFARYHVLGDRSAKVSGIVDGSQSVSQRVTFRRK